MGANHHSLAKMLGVPCALSHVHDNSQPCSHHYRFSVLSCDHYSLSPFIINFKFVFMSLAQISW